MRLAKPVRRATDLVAAKLPVFEAFEQLLGLVERSRFESAELQRVAGRVTIAGQPPSQHLARIARWAGFAELRQNPIFHVVANALLMWDVHVLWGIERFVRDVGVKSHEWFAALGELEALASLATLAHGDPDATFPEIVGPDQAFHARGLAHPLLAPSARIANDVALRGPGSALVITGSNMAGKSTLLRAVGQNIALALAGGPVIATQLRVPLVRLRASMRAEDSLESGASYFHAELTKLKTVVADADAEPPIFFLLDELLRGTNARARHVGGKAVLLHLLARRGTGLVATHDVELAALADANTAAWRIDNVHFTDVVVEGEMRFDYKLRDGIVRTSNALRLLALAGIDVPEQDRDAVTGPARASATHAGGQH
jgi:DNA mismatch repair ATPase MutS